MSILEDFKESQSELGKALEDYEVKEQKLNDRITQIFSKLFGIAKESERVAEGARKVVTHQKWMKILHTVLIALLFLIPIVEHFVKDEIMSFVIICVLLGLIFIVKFLRQYFNKQPPSVE